MRTTTSPVDITDLADIPEKLLTLQGAETLRFADGQTTELRSGRVIPLPHKADQRLCLDGDWSVKQGQVLPQLTDIMNDDCTNWPQVVQPGIVCIADPEVQPSAIPDWHRRFMRHIHEDDVVVLRKRVEVPPAWHDHDLHVLIEGAYPSVAVYVNGTCLAEHLSGLTPCSVSCSDMADENGVLDIGLVIRRRYPHQEIDMPRHSSDFAGLHGSVYVVATPRRAIAEHSLQTLLDEDLTSGRLRGVIGFSGAKVEGSLSLQVRDPNGALVSDSSWEVAADSARVDVDLAIDHPTLWCGEAPHLYQVTVRWSSAGAQQDLQWRVGFRRFAVINERPTVNGHPLKLRGMNLLKHSDQGLYTSKEWLRQNLVLMQKANINAVRTHLTASDALAELCDEMGFYLLQEVTIDWYTHRLSQHACLGECLLRIDGVLRRDRHHACLIALGIGNENLPGKPDEVAAFMQHFQVYYDYARLLSPETWIFWPPPGPANAIDGLLEPRMGNIADIHYNFSSARELKDHDAVTLPESWQGPMTTYTREQLLQGDWLGIWMSTEYGIVNSVADVHDAPYQSVICEESEPWLGPSSSTQALANRLEREWGLMRDDPRCLGGAYFPWMPLGVGDTWGWTFWAEDADWGLVTRDLTPKPQFWVLRAAYSPITFQQRRVTWNKGQDQIAITIRNRYSTIDLADCTLRTQMGATGKFMGILRDWRDIHIACAPGTDVTVPFELWHDDARKSLEDGKPILLRLHVLEPSGYRPITHDIVIVPEDLDPQFESGYISLGSDA
jgi:hypothetical protein